MRIYIESVDLGRRILKAIGVYCRRKKDGYIVYHPDFTFIKECEFVEWFNKQEFKGW